jgi:hypothetical protein
VGDSFLDGQMTEQIGLIWQEGWDSSRNNHHPFSHHFIGENLATRGQIHEALVLFQRAKALLLVESQTNYSTGFENPLPLPHSLLVRTQELLISSERS